MPLATFEGLTFRTQVLLITGIVFTIFGIAAMMMAIRVQRAPSEAELGQFVLLITTITGFVGAAWRESRNRKWAIEDRQLATAAQTEAIVARARADAEALLIQTEAKAQALHLEQLAQAEQLRTETNENMARIKDHADNIGATIKSAVEEATNAARSAFEEANNVNTKIADLNRQIVSTNSDVKVAFTAHDDWEHDERSKADMLMAKNTVMTEEIHKAVVK